MSVPLSESWQERPAGTWVWIAEISHPRLDEPIRVAVDTADVTYGGDVYRAGRMGFVPPNFAESEQVARIRVANTDRVAGSAIQRMVTPAQAVFALVDAADPDTGAEQWPPMLLVNVSGNAVEITGEFRSRIAPNDAFPKERADKSTAPGLFV